MNKTFNIVAPAKLNLNLFVKNKNPNNLHSLKSHVCFLDLVDLISFRFNQTDKFIQKTS